MGKLKAWIEKLLASSSQPTKPAVSKFGPDDSAAHATEAQNDYDMKMAVERERARRSSF